MATVLIGMTPNRSYDGSPGAPRPSVVTSDPPVHTALRNVVNRGFTPLQISAWKPSVERIVDDCVATMRAHKLLRPSRRPYDSDAGDRHR
jgi:cytochrome P450